MPTKEQRLNSKRRKDLGLAWCSSCKEDKPHKEFNKSPKRRPFGLCSRCNSCEKKRKSEQSKRKYWSLSEEDRYIYNREKNLKKNFGITLEDYDLMLESQNGMCAICKMSESIKHHSTGDVQPLVVDHDHKTGEVRGLLCTRCNKGIGLLMHNSQFLKNAIDYLS